MDYIKKYSKYFWDVDTADVDRIKYRDWIIARILEEGSTMAVKDLFDLYGKQDIVVVICKSRAISPRTARLWQLRLDMKEPIECMKKQLVNKP